MGTRLWTTPTRYGGNRAVEQSFVAVEMVICHDWN